MNKKRGNQTVMLDSPVSIMSAASIVGPKEGEGPLCTFFDNVASDELYDEESWEKAESKFVKNAVELAVQKSGKHIENIDYIFSGDLLNQSIGSTFGLRQTNRPFFGIFGACSTMGEGMSLAAMIIDGGYADSVLACASSHFCAAEKQFRYPLELGTQRTLTASWTVTGAGAAVLSKTGEGPYIKAITTGKIVDLGIEDANNMGAAMAPAAADTIINHLSDMKRQENYYDVIVTGDLGFVGKELVMELCMRKGVDLRSNFTDCGIEIFDRQKQDTHSGGSGCGCSAVTFCGYYYSLLKQKKINRMLFVPTGALLSPTSTQQKETIPGIAHAVAIEN